jgi:hypothetical protein
MLGYGYDTEGRFCHGLTVDSQDHGVQTRFVELEVRKTEGHMQGKVAVWWDV